MKKVSVVMCTYNGAKYLREQLDSIMNQTYPIYELIVQDDNSSDETCSIVREYQSNYDNIKLYINERNLGPQLNFGLAFTRATGDYICPSDQDDIWYSTKVERLIKESNDKYVIFSADNILSEEGSISVCDWNHGMNIYIYIYKGLPGHTTMISKSLVCNIYNGVEKGLAFDYMIGILGLLSGRIQYIDEPLQIWRRHSQTVTGEVIYQTYTHPFSEKIANKNKWLRVFACMFWLRKNYIARGVKDKFTALKNTIPHLKNEYKIADDFCELVDCLASPTLANILRAAHISSKHSNDMYGTVSNLHKRLAQRARAWRYPFDFIWSIRNEEYL